MTALGGAYGQGTIYKLSLSGDKFDLIYSFNGSQEHGLMVILHKQIISYME